MEQMTLVHEDFYEALKTVVQALGGAKDVGHKFWPEKTPQQAGEHLRNCLNPMRREQLNPEQVLWLLREGRRAGAHVAMDFIAGECGYAYQPIEPEDEAAELQRQFIVQANSLQEILQRYERAKSRMSIAK